MSKIIKWCVIFLIVGILLTGTAMAKSDKQISDDGQQCDEDNENVKEEIAGLSPDGKDILIKRTISHPAKSKNLRLSYTSNCYKLMGIKWATQNVHYVINPSNSNVATEEVIASFTKSGSTWDIETSRNLFGERTVDESTGYGYDGENTLFFGSSLNTGIIAQTTVWYYSISRQIVEFDIQFNNYFQWGNAEIDQNKMDLEGIATHEIGHGIGLADLYTTLCKEVTMYGYSTEGEFKKRTLETGDLRGLWRIYGS